MSHSNKAICINNLSNKNLIFRNFEGRKSNYNNLGSRNFNVVLDDVVAEMLEKEGFYIKKRVNDKGEESKLLKVNVKMDSKWPPEIHVFTKKGEQNYGADEVASLDDADVISGEVWINGYMGANSDHKTAWLDEMYVALRDNATADKYRKMFESTADIEEEDNWLPNEQMPWDD